MIKRIKEILDEINLDHSNISYKEIKVPISNLKDLYKRAGVDWQPGTYRKGKSFCCYDNELLVGHCWILDDGTIFNLIVDKKYRGTGIASNLLKQAIDGGGKYLACVKSLVKFYVDRGFRVYSTQYSKEFGENLYYMIYNN